MDIYIQVKRRRRRSQIGLHVQEVREMLKNLMDKSREKEVR